MFEHCRDESEHVWCLLHAPQGMHTVKDCLYYDDSARRDIERLQSMIDKLTEYRQLIAKRAALIMEAAYDLKLVFTRDRSYYSKHVTYKIELLQVYRQPGIRDFAAETYSFPGKDRKQAFAKFAEMQKLHPGIETETHLEKANWEK